MLTLRLVLLLAAATGPEKAIQETLDDWHQAAATGDEARYFSLFTDDGVFMGTDATERWTRDAFRTWAHPHFARGKAWAFRAVRRNVRLAPDGKVAWFDEELATEKLGPCRGSGVLVLQGKQWRIAHYVLSVPIPNAVFDEVKRVLERPAP
jgi:uncharacterized protein (TIGR02246 family)